MYKYLLVFLQYMNKIKSQMFQENNEVLNSKQIKKTRLFVKKVIPITSKNNCNLKLVSIIILILQVCQRFELPICNLMALAWHKLSSYSIAMQIEV